MVNKRDLSNPNSQSRRRQNTQGASSSHDDALLQQKIVNALGWDSWVDGNSINVYVAQGVVTLTGTVNSSTEKCAAGDDAWDVPGVVDVQNFLNIVR